MHTKALMAGMLFGLVLAGCDTGRPGGNVGDEPAAAVAADPAFVAEQESWRAARRERLLAPDGWASLVGLHWIELPAHYVGSGATSGIRLAKGPERMGLLQQQGGRVFFTPEEDAGLTVDGEPADGRFEMFAESSATPTVIGFDEGKGQVVLIERAGRKALRVKHAEAPTLTGLGELDYWPADPSWRIEGRFVPHPPGRTIQVVDITGRQSPHANPGAVEFERDGIGYRLEALDEGDGQLLLVLADRTSGHESYAAGRYLDAEPADADGRVVLDFNRAYNPPCVFTDFATCPLPPPENRLDLAITAGEKKYARP